MSLCSLYKWSTLAGGKILTRQWRGGAYTRKCFEYKSPRQALNWDFKGWVIMEKKKKVISEKN